MAEEQIRKKEYKSQCLCVNLSNKIVIQTADIKPVVSKNG